jgi:DNA adenine methylase
LNPGIAAFWRAILHSPDEFIERIRFEEISVKAWHIHRDTYLNPIDAKDIDLGFATFFLNRCNRSGILTARPIGGLEQTGRWKIDARFNRVTLAERVRHIGQMAENIVVAETDALEFIETVACEPGPVLIYADPPYLVKSEDLYLNRHSWEGHEKLARILSASRHPWVLTYDFDDRVRQLYSSNRCLVYNISHTAQTQKVGSELMLFSRSLRVRDLYVSSRRQGAWLN